MIIHITGTIDEAAYESFSKKLIYINNRHKNKVERITIRLNSIGGAALDALAIASLMRTSKNEFIVEVYGSAFSAAVIILAMADKRYMTKESWVMVHEESTKIKGTTTSLLRGARYQERLEDQWNLLLEENSDISKEDWARMAKEETFLSAKECLDFGLIDKIIEES